MICWFHSLNFVLNVQITHRIHTPEASTPTPTPDFILFLLLSICIWYCLNVHISRYSIPANQCWIWINTLHFLPPRTITHSFHCTTWTKQRFVSCYKIECMQLDLFYMLPGLCYLDSKWNTIITLIYPAGATVGATAGAALGVIVVVACVGILIVICRYRLSTYCCVTTLSILVLQLYFTFTTQTKTSWSQPLQWSRYWDDSGSIYCSSQPAIAIMYNHRWNSIVYNLFLHCPFQIAESLSLFQSLVSMWHRCIKTRTKDLSWSMMYVACTYLHIFVYIGIFLLLNTAFH